MRRQALLRKNNLALKALQFDRQVASDRARIVTAVRH